MRSLRKLALGGAVSLLVPGSAALAADYGTVPYGAAPEVPYEFSSGWYLRGDIGYSFNNTPDANFGGIDGITGENFSDTATGTVGFGYQVNNWFRSDFTLDYNWPGQLTGTCASVLCTGGATEHADISAVTGLLNAYFDLGNWNGFTPYVGGGIGVSYVSATGVHDSIGGLTTQTWADGNDWNFAWSLTAGASYALAPNWLVDVNYRYMNLGGVTSGAVSPASATPAMGFDNLSAHQVRVGLRYLIK